MSERTSPEVSVCIPVFNGSDYIAESIASVLGQTFKDFEVIVSDNASTDRTGEIVNGFKDARIRYVRNARNLGLVGNANRCLELARGEYVNILHHDDCMMPENLERKVRVLRQHRNVGLVHSDVRLIDSGGRPISTGAWHENTSRDYLIVGRKAFQAYLSYLPLGASIFIGAVLARRECYARLGGFRDDLLHCNDSEMWMRIALFYDVACIGSPLVRYRVHPASTSTGWGDRPSLPFLKEHYLAARSVFERYGARIPHSRRLRRKVSKAFGNRATTFAHRAISAGDFQFGRECVDAARKMCPAIWKSASFWKVAAILMSGPSGLACYRFVKKRLSRANA